MAYDEGLAERVRELVGGDPAVTEKKMFGGLAFLVSGSMAVTASSQGGLMVRVDPADLETLLTRNGASQMEMRGRPMKGWILVDIEQLRTKRQLAPWVKRGTDYARSLPQKK